MVVQRRDGLRRLRDHDDDGDDVCPGSLETTQEDRAHSQPERAGSCQ